MTAAAVTLDTVADESWKKMADGVVRSASRRCSTDGMICCYGDALSTISLLTFVPCFLLFVFRVLFSHFFPASRHVFVSSSRLFVCAASGTVSKYVFYSTCSFCCVICSWSFVPYPISEFFCFSFVEFFFFRSSYSRVAFLVLLLCTLFLQCFVFLCLTVCDHRLCISLG